MNKIILQPASDETAYKNYMNTIINPVPAAIIEKHVDSETYRQILTQYSNQLVPVWGIRNGKNDGNRKK